MADEPKAPFTTPQILPISTEYPGLNFPTVYVDSVSSVQPGIQTTKFYLSRFDPHMLAENKLLNQPVVQVVMPTSSFVDTAAFFGRMVKQLIDNKIIEQSVWDQAVANYNALTPKA